jgi:hypothetical protein
MAFFKLGAFGDTLRGKSGNTVFAKTRGGIVVRDRVIPANPKTSAQLLVRNNLSRSSKVYEGLSAARVRAWRKFGARMMVRTKGGKLRPKSGISAFNELATKFLQVNPAGTIPLDPPVGSYSGDSITISATAATGKITFSASAPNSANTRTEILLQELPNANRKPQANEYRTRTFLYFNSASPQDVTVDPGYYAVAYRFVNNLTGQMTEMTVLPVQQVALALAPGSATKKAA